MNAVITVAGRIAKRIREEARRLGMASQEYLVELVTQGLDPRDQVVEYVESAKELLEGAREELERGDVRQVAEKAWGAAALVVKAYAEWREGRRLTSHKELWEYKRVMERDVGEWVHNAWMNAVGMHVCFYEGWCVGEDVGRALEEIARLVEGVERRVKLE